LVDVGEGDGEGVGPALKNGKCVIHHATGKH